MKKTTLLVAALMMASTSAMASKARMTALGQDPNTGSDYISDNRNIFANPALMMEGGDHANFEAGRTGGTTAQNNAEGGFVKSAGAMKYGIQLGRDTALNSAITDSGLAFQNVNNVFDLMVAGDAGIKWGVGLQYGAAENQDTATFNKKANVMGISAGVYNDMFAVNLNMDNSKAEGAATEDDELKYSATNLDASYNLGEGKSVYAGMETTKIGDDGKGSETHIGYANVMKMDAANTFFYSVSYAMGSEDDGTTKTTTTSLPITIGFEADATSWLVLRGSVAQNVLIDSEKGDDDTDTHAANSTTVAAGAGLKFNKIVFDATLGGTTAEGGSSAAGTGDVNGNNLFTNASFTYNF